MNRKSMLLALVAAMSVTGAADAQSRYFMRTKVAPATTPTAEPTWSYGQPTTSCVSGTRYSTETATCSSTGCNPATKPADRTTAMGACAPVCGQLTQYQYSLTGTASRSVSSVNSVAEAQPHCGTMSAASGKPGVCMWRSDNKAVYYFDKTGYGMGRNTAANYAIYHAAECPIG